MLSLTQAGEPTLTVRADRGRIAGDRDHGDFAGHVRVDRAADPRPANGEAPSGPVTLTTESLQVLTKEQRVLTDQPVTIEEPRGIIRGRGLQFDNKAKRVRITSQVSGTLQPQNEPPK
jgi:LPS export ABC transporter protein LptC